MVSKVTFSANKAKKTTGFYFLVEFTGEGSLVNTLETQYRRDERVIRFLTFKCNTEGRRTRR